jgi:putative transcriptional regulator
MRRPPAIALFVAATLAIASLPAFAQDILERAFLLVANPRMQDENFSATVVLVVNEGPGGPLGVILNRPTTVPMREVYPERAEFAGRDDLLFFGGPVQPDALLFAFRSPVPPAKGVHVADDIYISGFGETLDELLKHPEEARNQRFFTGYAGWGMGQLEVEIAQGGWYVMRLDTHAIFDMNPLDLYPEFLRRATTPRIETRLGSRVAAAH